MLRIFKTITIEVTRDSVRSDLDEVAARRVDKVSFVKTDYELIQILFDEGTAPFVISLVGLAMVAGGTRAVCRPIFTVRGVYHLIPLVKSMLLIEMIARDALHFIHMNRGWGTCKILS